jgi:hypothetical protein
MRETLLGKKKRFTESRTHIYMKALQKRQINGNL